MRVHDTAAYKIAVPRLNLHMIQVVLLLMWHTFSDAAGHLRVCAVLKQILTTETQKATSCSARKRPFAEMTDQLSLQQCKASLASTHLKDGSAVTSLSDAGTCVSTSTLIFLAWAAWRAQHTAGRARGCPTMCCAAQRAERRLPA